MISTKIGPRSIEIYSFLGGTSTWIMQENPKFPFFCFQSRSNTTPRWPEFSLPFASSFQSRSDTTSRLSDFPTSQALSFISVERAPRWLWDFTYEPFLFFILVCHREHQDFLSTFSLGWTRPSLNTSVSRSTFNDRLTFNFLTLSQNFLFSKLNIKLTLATLT